MLYEEDYELGIVEKLSPTTWKEFTDCGGWNSSFMVEVASKGIYIDTTLYTWNEINQAKLICK